MSTGNPKEWSVSTRPPIRSRDSNTTTLNRELCRKRAAARPPNPAPITITVGVDDVADATATLTPHRLDSDVVLDSFEGAIDGAVPSAYYLPALKLQMSAEGDSKIHRHTCRSEANPRQ